LGIEVLNIQAATDSYYKTHYMEEDPDVMLGPVQSGVSQLLYNNRV